MKNRKAWSGKAEEKSKIQVEKALPEQPCRLAEPMLICIKLIIIHCSYRFNKNHLRIIRNGGG